MIFFKLGITCGGRFPAPRASITKPLVGISAGLKGKDLANFVSDAIS